MIKIAHTEETTSLRLPNEVIKVIKDVATILDNEYGVDRDVDGGDGGYILVIESQEELEQLKDIYIDIDTVIAEYVDEIEIEGRENWTNSLILCNNDFGVTLIMPLIITPDNLKNEIIK